MNPTGPIAAVLAVSLLPLGTITLAAPAPGASASQPLTVCALKKDKRKHPAAGAVTINALLAYNADYGYFLQEPSWPSCEDKIDGTGLLKIALPKGKSLKDFPQLKKAASQDYLRNAKGKRLYCTCSGQLSYTEGTPAFELSKVDKVWTGD